MPTYKQLKQKGQTVAIIQPATSTEYTEEQEYFMVYDNLLAMAKEVEIDPALTEFSDDAQRQLEEFQENYPEIVAEYDFSSKGRPTLT